MKLTIGRVMFGGDNWVNYYYTLDTFDWPSISCGDGAPGSGCPGHVHPGVRLPSRGQQPDPRSRRSGPQGGALAGVHVRHRSRADEDDVDRRALRAQVGRLRDRGGLQLHAERAKRTAASTIPASAASSARIPLGRSNPAQPRRRARLRRHRGAAAQAAREPMVGGRQLSLQLPARQLVRHRELRRSRRQPAAELGPVVQPALLLVRHAGQRRPSAGSAPIVRISSRCRAPTTCRGARWSA